MKSAIIFFRIKKVEIVWSSRKMSGSEDELSDYDRSTFDSHYIPSKSELDSDSFTESLEEGSETATDLVEANFE